MSIVATEIESVHGADNERHLVFYRCQDHTGAWHSYGPIHAVPGFDREGFKVIVADKVSAYLAEAEAQELLL
jgi:hypothetical protein